jgi:hypothetical protein
VSKAFLEWRLPVTFQVEAHKPSALVWLIELLNMKTKKSAAAAALKPIEKTSNSSVPRSTSGALTTIDVKIDVGFGNAVFLRGQGSGLTWEHGVPLACVDGSTWRWSQTTASPITFKVLINDQVWSAGNDLVVTPGQKLEVAPSFA